MFVTNNNKENIKKGKKAKRRIFLYIVYTKHLLESLRWLTKREYRIIGFSGLSVVGGVHAVQIT